MMTTLKPFSRLAAIVLMVLVATGCSSFASNPVYVAWNVEYAAGTIARELRNDLDNNNSYGLYDLQLKTYHQLMWLRTMPNDIDKRNMIDDMAALYSIPLEPGYRKSGAMDENSNVVSTLIWVCGSPMVNYQPPPGMAKRNCPISASSADYNRESFLYSVQYLYGATKVLDSIAQIPAANRTTAMNVYVSQMTPVVIQHADRWLKGTKTGNQLMSQYVANTPRVYLTDETMQFVGLVSELYSAAPRVKSIQRNIAARPAGSPNHRDYLTLRAFPELQARTKEYPSVNDAALNRAVFDASLALDRNTSTGLNVTDSQCAYYSAGSSPISTEDCINALGVDAAGQPLTKARRTTFDLSHYVRVVFMLDSLGKDVDSNIATWARATTTKMARHFVEKVAVPGPDLILANYFGDNRGSAPKGWVRVYFNAAGDVLGSTCNNTPGTNVLWTNCAPHAPWPPGYFSSNFDRNLISAYFVWGPRLPEMQNLGNAFFAKFPPTTSRNLAMQHFNNL